MEHDEVGRAVEAAINRDDAAKAVDVETLDQLFGDDMVYTHVMVVEGKADEQDENWLVPAGACTGRGQLLTGLLRRSVARSLVAHLVRDEGVAGSNPATPTNSSALSLTPS